MVVSGMTAAGAGVVFLAGLADAAWSDLCALRIANRDPVLLVLAFLAAAVAQGFGGWDLASHCAAALVVFAGGAGLFALGIWGGGDAKLLAAAALWTGFAGLPRLLGVMAVAGGGIALIVLALGRLGGGKAGTRMMWLGGLMGGKHVPYGIAIAAAGLDWWLAIMLPRFGV